MKKLLLLLLLFVNPAFAQEEQSVLNFGLAPIEVKPETNPVWQEQLDNLVQYNDENDALIYRFLYKALEKQGLLSPLEKETGRLGSLDQGSVGSCVGYGTTRALAVTAACDILVRNEAESYKARFNPDAIYAITRADNLGRWDGSRGAWAVSGLQKYGSLHKLVYGQYDLTNTRPQQGREWSAAGLPPELLEEAKKHKTLSSALVKTPEEAKAALQNGYGIILCANVSYATTRDQMGFSPRTRQGWAHCLACIGYRGPNSGKEGFLIANSWGGEKGEWINGPIWPEDMVYGSFWVTPEDLAVHLREGDSYAIAGYEGFKRRKLKWNEVFKIGEDVKDEE